MTLQLSANTQAVLLLTAPLITGTGDSSSDLLTPSEYRKLELSLTKLNLQPADLLTVDPTDLFDESTIAIDRILRLSARGFQLSQAVENWQARSIWVVSRWDDEYPARLKQRLPNHAPPVIYGCGDPNILALGGLAVVGSREVDAWLVQYTENIGKARLTLSYQSFPEGQEALIRHLCEEPSKLVGNR